MRFTKPKIIQIALPLAILGLFYWGVYRFTYVRETTKRRPTTKLSEQESRKLTDLSESLFRQNKYKAALDPTLKLYEAYPENHIYIRRLAEIYDHLGQYKEEAAFWEKYLNYAPRPIEGCPEIGEAYWKQGDAAHKQAIAAYERCLALDPTNTDSIFYLAHALEMSGQFDRAAELYRRGLSLAPGYLDMRLGLARVWMDEGKLDQAKDTVLQILASSPNKVDALLVLGLVYLRENKLDEAKKCLEKGVHLAEGYTDFHIALARVAEKQKDIPEAIRQYNEILKLDPGDQAIRTRLAELQKTKP